MKKFRFKLSGSRIRPHCGLVFQIGSGSYVISDKKYYHYITKYYWHLPKWIEKFFDLQHAYKMRNYMLDPEEIETQYQTGFQFILCIIKQWFCEHNYEMEDTGNAENGPCIYYHCIKCGKSGGPNYMN